MRALLALVIYLASIIIGGALLAPWMWHLAQWGEELFPGKFFQGMAHAPFHRFMDRGFLIVALGGLWPLLRALGLRSRSDLGLVSPRGEGSNFLRGLAMGVSTLGVVAVLAVGLGGRPFVHSLTIYKLVGIIFNGLGTAAAVATLEEILFRGGIFSGLRQVMSWPTALIFTSLVYAFVHFLQQGNVTGPVGWASGLAALQPMMAGFANFSALVPCFFTLVLAGMLLGLGYQTTNTLYFSIGMHGGWIFWLKIYRSITTDASGPNAWLWGTSKLIDGWAAFFVLFVVLVGWCVCRSPRKTAMLPATS